MASNTLKMETGILLLESEPKILIIIIRYCGKLKTEKHNLLVKKNCSYFWNTNYLF